MSKVNVTLRDDILAELDELVEVGASGSRSATLAGLVRSSWRATFPARAHDRTVMESPGPVTPPPDAPGGLLDSVRDEAHGLNIGAPLKIRPPPRGGEFSKGDQAGKAKR